jgi:hypothetical protein
MIDEPDSLVLVYLRRIDEKVDRLAAGQLDLSRRVTSLETKVALLHGDLPRSPNGSTGSKCGSTGSSAAWTSSSPDPFCGFPSPVRHGSMGAGGNRP